MRLLAFDTETTGIPIWDIPSDDPKQPYITQLAAVMFEDGVETSRIDMLVKPDGWELTPELVAFNEQAGNGITMERLEADGKPLEEVIEAFMQHVYDAQRIVAHNLSFDRRLVRIALKRLGRAAQADDWKADDRFFCTMKEATDITKLDFKKPKPGMYKSPKLEELYRHCFSEEMGGSHNALSDALATAKCYFHLFGHHPEARFYRPGAGEGGFSGATFGNGGAL